MKITVSELKRIIKEEVELAEVESAFKSKLKSTGRTEKVGELLGKSTALQGVTKGVQGTEIAGILANVLKMLAANGKNLDAGKILQQLKALKLEEIEGIISQSKGSNEKKQAGS